MDDPTQQDAMRAMVKTYGQMPLQLFKDHHQPRSKSTVITAFRIRIGTALKRLTSSSSSIKLINPYVWKNVQLLKQKDPKSLYNLEFIGRSGAPPPAPYNMMDTLSTPERLVWLSGGEIVVMAQATNFFPASTQTQSSMLVTWDNWDNTVIVRSVGSESGCVRLHHHPLNKACGYLSVATSGCYDYCF